MAIVREEKKNFAQRLADATQSALNTYQQTVSFQDKLKSSQQQRDYMASLQEQMKARAAQQQVQIKQQAHGTIFSTMKNIGGMQNKERRKAAIKRYAPILQEAANSAGIPFDPNDMEYVEYIAEDVSKFHAAMENWNNIANENPEAMSPLQFQRTAGQYLQDLPSGMAKEYKTMIDQMTQRHQERLDTISNEAKAGELGLEATKMVGDKVTYENTALQERLAAKEKSSELSEKKEKQTMSLRKEATSGQLGKLYEKYKINAAGKANLDAFHKDPSGYSDYGSLMQSLKTLQNDSSVVREAEMRLGQNATSLINKVKNAIENAATGRALQPQQREEISKVMNIMFEVNEDLYTNAVRPIYRQAKKNELPLEQIFEDPSIFEGKEKEDPKKPGDGKAPQSALQKELKKAGGKTMTIELPDGRVAPGVPDTPSARKQAKEMGATIVTDRVETKNIQNEIGIKGGF
jgi:hypothetical protein